MSVRITMSISVASQVQPTPTDEKPRLSIVSAYLDTKCGGRLDSVAVLEHQPGLGFKICAQQIGKDIEASAIARFKKQFPTAVCEV